MIMMTTRENSSSRRMVKVSFVFRLFLYAVSLDTTAPSVLLLSPSYQTTALCYTRC